MFPAFIDGTVAVAAVFRRLRRVVLFGKETCREKEEQAGEK